MILAHGIGERGDLPLPLFMFTWAMILALVISFVALGVLWTEPRLATAARGRPLSDYRNALALHHVGRATAFVLYLTSLAAAFFGTNLRGDNLVPVTFYVVVWVGAQLIGGLIGDAWGAVNPIATLARLSEGAARLVGRPPVPGPQTWGHWPAALGMFIFLFYELSHPSGADPRTLAGLLGVHALFTIAFGAMWGASWVVEHEPFTVFFAKVGAMAPLTVETDSDTGKRTLRARWPMSGLGTMTVRNGTVALILIAIGGTSFDGFSESELGREVFGDFINWELAVWELGGLILSVGFVAALYAIGVWWTDRVTGIGFNRAWHEFAPSLVPIAFGYAVAHYYQLFSDEVQSFVFRLSDPFGQGWDLFGGSDGLIWQVDPDIVSWVQVAAILFGHIGAVAVAHDRAIELFPVGKSLQSQFAMLFVMIGYSALGLWLLLTA